MNKTRVIELIEKLTSTVEYSNTILNDPVMFNTENANLIMCFEIYLNAAEQVINLAEKRV